MKIPSSFYTVYHGMKISYNNPQDLTFLQKGFSMKRLALSLLLCVPTTSMYSMDVIWGTEMYSSAQLSQEEFAKKMVLATPVQELTEKQLAIIDTAFYGENIRAIKWLLFHMNYTLSRIQQTVPDATIEMMGSRRWETSHLLSDIDAAVVTKDPDHEKVVDALATYYTNHYPQITQFRMKTKAGLSLFTLKDFSDPHLGFMKLEYTIQSPETNNTIVTAMKEKLETQFPSLSDKLRYACAMMAAVHNKDEAAQAKLKEWTRILPAQEKKS